MEDLNKVLERWIRKFRRNIKVKIIRIQYRRKDLKLYLNVKYVEMKVNIQQNNRASSKNIITVELYKNTGQEFIK